MKHSTLLFLPFLLLPFLLLTGDSFAQAPLAQVVSSSGGYFTGGNASLSFTLGETTVQAYTGAGAILTQGFQQPLDASAPLPLHILSFTAILSDGRTQLQWMTDQEVNTSYFNVERSTDGLAFSTLFTVQSINNPATMNTYHATDSFPHAGKDYYRLKEVDLSGSVSYSPIVVVILNTNLSCTVYPNPATSQVFIHIQTDAARQATVNWYDTRGRLLLSRAVELVAGANQVEFDFHGFAKGMYIVRITGLDGLPSFTILKQ